jgi:hypothetical protein
VDVTNEQHFITMLLVVVCVSAEIITEFFVAASFDYSTAVETDFLFHGFGF